VHEPAHTRGAAHDEYREARLLEPEPPAQRVLLARRRWPEAEINRQAEQLDPLRRHTPAQRDPARVLGGRDDQVGVAERPSAVEVDEVRDHRHQPSRPPLRWIAWWLMWFSSGCTERITSGSFSRISWPTTLRTPGPNTARMAANVGLVLLAWYTAPHAGRERRITGE